MSFFRRGTLLPATLIAVVVGVSARGDRPSTAYIFPAGGRRGTTVKVRIGGYNLHDSAAFHLQGGGIAVPKRVTRTSTLFFEGPVIPQPPSQGKEDYPKDYAATVRISGDARLGTRRWRVSTAQGVTAARKFIVGDLPEVVEREIDGAPIPVDVKLPVTVNGRIFPREDVDIWRFAAKKGQTVTCEVNASRFGSPLDSRLEVRDADGRRIAENTDALGTDSRLIFTAPRDGRYAVRIHDVKFQGLQSYVYRLTITAGPQVTSVFPLGGRRGETIRLQLRGANVPESLSVKLPRSPQPQFTHRIRTAMGVGNSFRLELDDLPEYDDASGTPGSRALPAVFNGRILQAGEVDAWRVSAKKGEQWLLDLKAARLGSPLDSVLTVVDATGKQIATSDDMGSGQTDSQLRLTIPADGVYTVRVQDRLASRGGPDFAYRLRIAKPVAAGPGFRVRMATDALSVDRGKSAALKLSVERLGGFQSDIALKIAGLPKGVTVTGTKIAGKTSKAQLTFKVDGNAKIGLSSVRIDARATIGGKPVTQRVVPGAASGEPAQTDLLLAVALPTPFKFTAPFETRYGARGSTFTRHYKLERGGFQGPITVRLADIQARHLQGVSGKTIVVPAGKSEFDYTISMPPWMEIGRTSRTCIMAVGVVTGKDGRRHQVSYSTTGQDEQFIVLVDPGRLAVRLKGKTLQLQRGRTVAVPVQVARGNGLSGPVTVELVVAGHIRGVTAKPIVIPSKARNGMLHVAFGKTGCGPFNMPLIIRATLNKRGKQSHVAETLLPVVVDGKPTPIGYFNSRR
ncbi:MAG: PPC domain-containing protein [Planctomycetaceae bacterium]